MRPTRNPGVSNMVKGKYWRIVESDQLINLKVCFKGGIKASSPP